MASKATQVYRGYKPANLPQLRPPNRIKPWWKVLGKPRVTLYPKKEVEPYSEEPEYPPLKHDGTKKSIATQVRLDWYDSLKSLPTVDHKMHEILKHSWHNIAHLTNWINRYNALPLTQYLTQTYLIDALPDSYSQENIDQSVIDDVRRIVLDQIAIDKYNSTKMIPRRVSRSMDSGYKETHVSHRIIQNIFHGLRKRLVLENNSELLDYHVDYNPAVRSWWYHSGLEPPNKKIFFKSRMDSNGFINQMIQIDSNVAMSLRPNCFIEPILPMDHPKVTDTSLVERCPYTLSEFGSAFKFRRPVSLTGQWFGQNPDFDFPHTAFVSADCLKIRNLKEYKVKISSGDEQDCLESQAILTSFSWLNSLSMYHGYTPFQEIDYPFTCQLITTDGQNWLFNVYQLNSHTFHRDLGGPKRNNICWSSGLMKLYSEYSDGQFEQVNDDVIKLLVRFLSQKTSPEYTKQLNLRPNLGEDCRTDEQKEEMSKELRRFLEQRKNNWYLHQWRVPLWEKIFFRSKVTRNQIRFMKPIWRPPKPKYPKIFE